MRGGRGSLHNLPRLSREDELVRMLLRALRRRIEDGAFSSDEAVVVAEAQLVRPGGPRLSPDNRARLKAALHVEARLLEPPTPRALLGFARAAARLGFTLETKARSPGAVVEEHLDDVGHLARAAVYAEVTRAQDQEQLLQRAVTRAVRARKRGRPGMARVPLDDGDPLRELLDLPSHGRVALPRHDVRLRIARAATEEGAFGTALRKAARFDPATLALALGEELATIGIVVGFADAREKKVLVEVRSSILAQEVQLRSKELVYRLKKVPGFEAVTGVQVVVRPPSSAGA